MCVYSWKPDLRVETPATAAAAAEAAAAGHEQSNSGDDSKPLYVPGLNGVPVYAPQPGNGGIIIGYRHAALDLPAICVDRLLAREIAMLRVMNAITDTSGWHAEVLDEEAWARWRREEYAGDWEELMSDAAWQWCRAELVDKAKHFGEIGGVYVLESASKVFKSDTLVPTSLRDELTAGVAHLLEAHGIDNLGKDGPVTSLVDPSLYPLVYGRSPVLTQGGRVPLEASSAPLCGTPEVPPRVSRTGPIGNRGWTKDIHGRRFSDEFQWLPCDVSFAGTAGTDVRITSYINGLHPAQDKPLYAAIEKLIALSIEPWDKVLMPRDLTWRKRLDRGTKPIVDYAGVPDWWEVFMRGKISSPGWQAHLEKAEAYLGLSRATSPLVSAQDQSGLKGDGLKKEVRKKWRAYLEKAKTYLGSGRTTDSAVPTQDQSQSDGDDLKKEVRKKWQAHHVVHPDIDMDLYNQWWSEQNYSRIGYPSPTTTPTDDTQPSHQCDTSTLRLQDRFRTQGLQVIVELTSVDLLPSTPRYRGKYFTFAGALNEKIVARTTYCLSAANITPSYLTLRQRTPDLASLDRDAGPAAEAVYGADFCNLPGTDPMLKTISVLEKRHAQETGRVRLSPGRMLCLPNALHVREEPVELLDKTRPGHRRCLNVYLVDPTSRLCSTRNVPAQRRDWWEDEVRAVLAGALPPELVDMILDRVGDAPAGKMDREEAVGIKKRADEDQLSARTAVMEELYSAIIA